MNNNECRITFSFSGPASCDMVSSIYKLAAELNVKFNVLHTEYSGSLFWKRKTHSCEIIGDAKNVNTLADAIESSVKEYNDD